MPGWSQGIYISGWRFDWGEARKDEERFRKAGRHWMAAACADPGVTSCATCGEMCAAEFEVFECGRCGATCTLVEDNRCESGPAKYPNKVRSKLEEGMKLRYIGKNFRGKPPLAGQWPAGDIEVGCVGIAVRDTEDKCQHVPCWLFWPIDGRKPAQPDLRWGIFGPFIPDEFEKV